MCALHLAATIAQTISTNSMLDNRISACSEAVHTLCDLLDISHASLLLHQTSDVLETLEPSGSVMVQFLLAKSHYLLVAGKVRLFLNHFFCFIPLSTRDNENYKPRATYLWSNLVCCKIYYFTLYIEQSFTTCNVWVFAIIFYACQCLCIVYKNIRQRVMLF